MPLFKFDNEQQWLGVRSKDLTSTEVASLLGVSKYKSRFKLWQEKSGNIEPDFEDNPFTIWGRRLQIPVALGISEDNGWTCNDLTLYYAQHDTIRLGASMDHKIVCPKRGIGLMEVKTTAFFSKDNGWIGSEAPIEYECQLQTQLHLAKINGSSFDFGVIAALDGRKDTKTLFRKYDPAFGELLEREAALFWESIQNNYPPDPDYIADDDLINKMLPEPRAGEKIILTGNPEAEAALEEWKAADKDLREINSKTRPLESRKKAAKNKILSLSKNAEIVIIGDTKITTRKQVTEDRFIYGSEFRRFDLSERK